MIKLESKTNSAVRLQSSRFDSSHQKYTHSARDPSMSPQGSPASEMPLHTSPQIAVCGIGLRLPGGVNSQDALWDLLINSKDTRGPIPASRYNIEGFDGSLGSKGAIKTRHGYFLSNDLSTFDPSFFSMTRSEMEKSDPQLRQLLEVTRECLDDAGEVNYRGRKIGCYVGTFNEDWLQMSMREDQHLGGNMLVGHLDIMLANRVSYENNFMGPSMVIKTGCSASLVALHEACRAVQNGDATAAIVAGTSVILAPVTTAGMTDGGVLSPEGSCKTFDASADGYARAESITAVYIKPLEAALRDGNPIRAIIRGSGTNSDGKSGRIMTPNGKAHEDLMRGVYAAAGLDPRDTAFVECHGTGTPTGDPIETAAVGRVFNGGGNPEHPVYIGSIKPNVGHSEGSSGITSVIKAVLALEHKTIPPNIKMINPNPAIPFREYHLRVPLAPTPFPAGRAERVSINSFGIGGANAHVASAPNGSCNGLSSKREALPPRLFLFSATTPESLQKQIQSHQEFVQQHVESATDIAYTRAVGREKLAHRAFAILKDDNTVFAEVSLPAKVKSQHGASVALVFSGQGAQWPEMGKALIQADPTFRQSIVDMDEILQSLQHPPKWTLFEELQKPVESSQIHSAELAQPLSTALQVALSQRFSALGLKPVAAVGHSSGEIAAAFAAGALSLAQAVTLAYYRGYVLASQPAKNGAMAALGMSREDAAQFLQPVAGSVVVACENSPTSITISGDADKVDAVIAAIKQSRPETLTRKLKVDAAYHSHHMVSPGCEYRRLVEEEDLEIRSNVDRNNGEGSLVDLFSSVSGKRIVDPATLELAYWETNLTSPVKFSLAVANLLEHRGSDVIFLEIGPHSTLAGPLRQICAAGNQPCNYVSSMARGSDGTVTILSAVGQLYKEGVELDFAPLFPRDSKILPGLPTYPWDRSASFWYESRVSKAWRSRKYAHHCILGTRVTETPDTLPQWRNVLYLENEPWLADHKVSRNVVFPFAGYVAMAGEAVRQTVGGALGTGYQIRHVVAHTALLMVEAKPVEMITSLRRHRLTDSMDSEWFDFSITSTSGTAWVKHCDGQIRAVLVAPPRESIEGTILEREVNMASFYGTMAKVGLVFGPEFRLLNNVTVSPMDRKTVARIVDPSDHRQAAFTLHPATIDAALQLMFVASAQGLSRNFSRLAVPTLIEELEVHTTSVGPIHAMAKFGDNPKSPTSGVVECVSEGRLVLAVRGITLKPLDDRDTNDERESTVGGSSDVHGGARLHWIPDFDFCDISKLLEPFQLDRSIIRMQEELALLCILETADRIVGLVPSYPHFEKLRGWLSQQINCARAGSFLLVDGGGLPHMALPRKERLLLLEDRFQKLLTISQQPATAIALKRTCDNADRVFTGQADTLDILMEDGVLTDLYATITFGYSKVLRLLSQTRPNLRILEVGAGTGGTTEPVLRELSKIHGGGFPAYSSYTFTDVSAGFFPQAQDRFAYASNMEYKVFDISKSPFEQGFEADSYDLILASNVIHATPCLRESLSHLQALLRHDGMLLMTEVCTTGRIPTYVFGHFSGWWLGEADSRPDQPHVSVERWDAELKAAGFTGCEVTVYDEEPPYRSMVAILSKKQSPQSPPNPDDDKRVTILADRQGDGVTARLAASFIDKGWDVTVCPLGSTFPDQDIVCCLDMESNFFEDMTAKRLAGLQSLLGELKDKAHNILWLTKLAQLNCKDPRAAAAIGVARSIRSELSIPFVTLEIDDTEPEFDRIVLEVLTKVRKAEETDNLKPDMEFAVDAGVIHIPRFTPVSVLELRAKCTSAGSESGVTTKRLEMLKPGPLKTMYWREEELEPVPPGHIDVETRAAGLNYRDVLQAAGVLTTNGPSRVNFGFEVSGIVARVGLGVTKVQPGDRVLALTTTGGVATRVSVHAGMVVKIPDSMKFEDAAASPVCIATVLFSLLHIGRLEKGDTVLIHSACGGVGLFALQVCRLVGADVLATVGSEAKVAYLEGLGIPRSRVFSSRDASFVDGVSRETAGRGVDIVLNSLSGDLLHESWRCVAEYGTLVELGKRDIMGAGKLDMKPFLQNRSYCCFDLLKFVEERPDKLTKVLEEFLSLYRNGSLKCLDDLTVFDAATEVEQAFRHLQNPDHIGKVVLRMPRNGETAIAGRVEPRPFKLRTDAAYIVIGGVGGLGRSLATWLVERGAKHITFLSRSAGISEKSRKLSVELESMGCQVHLVAGDVSNMADVKRAVLLSLSSGHPVRGVLQLAMVLADTNLLDMSLDDWITATKPKIDGTWNLHHALQDQPLDFFWMSSSNVTVMEQGGQGNYIGANTFMEAFCQYRHSVGLPASVLNICPIDDVGMVAENEAARRSCLAQGMTFLGEREFLEFVEVNIQTLSVSEYSTNDKTVPSNTEPVFWSNKSQLVMGLRSEMHLDDPANRASWRRDRRMGIYHNARTNVMAKKGDTPLKQLMDQLAKASRHGHSGVINGILDDPATVELLAQEVGKKVYDFMLIDKSNEILDSSLSLQEIGMDSLMAIELKRWSRQAFGVQVSVLEIVPSSSLINVGGLMARKLREKLVKK
ncbi:hypothetical protein B0H63DRAFT_530309 [Podospora didyma]|uniref:Polyketide synthase n=1 Tax=Podospora didyma TaxID=330526 RepID=A0AAE0P3S4_9PEZI|nr:hypothetical protein B0H63DRAFT_530309 [Podospora didyma]